MTETPLINKSLINDSCVSSLKDNSFLSETSEKQDSVRNLYPNPQTFDYPSSQKPDSESSISNILPNLPDRFSLSQVTSSITFQSSGETTTSLLPSKKFAVCSNATVTTFLLENAQFSQFTNPKEIERDPRIKAYFLIKNTKHDKFMCNLDELTERLSLQGDYDNQNVITFLRGLNAFFKEKEYVHIKHCNTIKWLLLYGVMFILFILSACMILYDVIRVIYGHIDNGIVYMCHGVVVLCGGGGVYWLHMQRNKVHMTAMFKVMKYCSGNYAKYFEYVEAWNRSIFQMNHIRVSIPVSVDYLLFNMEPYQDIRIKDIDMEHIKSQMGVEGMLFEAAVIESGDDARVSEEGINGVRYTQSSDV